VRGRNVVLDLSPLTQIPDGVGVEVGDLVEPFARCTPHIRQRPQDVHGGVQRDVAVSVLVN
jgi:hypothetical protein